MIPEKSASNKKTISAARLYVPGLIYDSPTKYCVLGYFDNVWDVEKKGRETDPLTARTNAPQKRNNS